MAASSSLAAMPRIIYTAIEERCNTQRQQAQRDQAQRDRERERDHCADARTLRDAKRERLRVRYSTLVASAWAMNDFTVETQVGPAEESDE